VCRTIDKKLVSILSIGSGRTNESNEINKKEAWSVWRKRGSEDKCSWSDDVIRSTSLEANFIRGSEDHQELKIIRSWKNCSFKGCSMDPIKPNIAENYKVEATANSNGFEVIGCLFVGKSWKRTIVGGVQPLPPQLCFVSATRQE